MKKVLCLLLASLFVLCLVGCDGKPADNNGGNNTPTEGYSFTYNGTKIAMKAAVADLLTAIGPWKSYNEETSCAFEGLDKTYFYGSFYLETYPQGDKDYVSSVWFADDSVATEEGVAIGDDMAKVEQAYGKEAYNGTNAFVCDKGESRLTVLMADGVVSSIQYAALFE